MSADHVRSGDWWKDIPDNRPDVRKQAEKWPCDPPPEGCGAAQGNPCTQVVQRFRGHGVAPETVTVKRRMPCLSRLKKVEGPKLL